jgi:hypothetical protein
MTGLELYALLAPLGLLAFLGAVTFWFVHTDRW